jgi:hypothetical protein
LLQSALAEKETRTKKGEEGEKKKGREQMR